MANHGLRTSGRPTGNFGRPKQKGKPGELDLTSEILNREDLRIPERDEAFTKLVIAYNTTDDPRLKAGLWEILKRRQAQIKPTEVKPNERPRAEFWEMVRNSR